MQHDHGAHKCNSRHGRHRRGPSSYWMHDPEAVFGALALKSGDWFLDLGSGPGDYSLRAAELVGPQGRVFALDKWDLAFHQLSKRALDLGYEHLKPMLSDINQKLPIKDCSIDLCFISTVLHIFPQPKFEHGVFREIRRVLNRCGRLAIIECKKEDQPWGPPKHMRISSQGLARGLKPHGFSQTSYTDLGKNYMLQFELS